MNNHLFITDLDGTLLNRHKAISSYSRKWLNHLIDKKKIHFTVATARSYRFVSMIFSGITLQLPVILKNGAVIADFSTGRHLHINKIEHEYWNELIDDLGELMLSPFMSTFNGHEEKYYYDNISGDGMKWYIKEMQDGNDKRLQKLSILHKVSPTEQVLSVSVINRLEIIEKAIDELQHKYRDTLYCHFYEELYHKGWYWAVFTSKLATKDQALKVFCRQTGFHLNDTTAFGDSHNDKQMLQSVKYGIAVANADKRLIDIATQVIGSNEENSVVKYINKATKNGRFKI